MLIRLFLPILLGCLVVTSPFASGQLLISEFLASNSNSIRDEDNNTEDWIEIENNSGATVNLTGWYLTDNVNQPRKWPFPAWTLNNGGRLVVFASEKNRRPAQVTAGQDNNGTPAQPRLHTDFKLSADGEYLALTKDIAGGGVQVMQAFNPYPQQATDVSYGSAVNTPSTPLLAAGAPVKALIPASGALGDTWKGAAASEPFDDSAWLAGTTGVGFSNVTPVGSANLRLQLNFDAAPVGTTLPDSSTYNHPATNAGAGWVASNTDAAPTPKTRNGLLQFNQVENDQIVIPGHADFDATQCTVSFWMRAGPVTGTGSEGAMLWDRRTGTGVGRGTVINLTTGGTVRFQAGDGAAGVRCQFDSNITVNNDQWRHIAYVINTAAGGVCTVYVDGVARGSATNTGAWGWTTATPIEMGRSHDGFWYRYNGLLDDVRFYNAALTPADITQLATGADDSVPPSSIGLNVQTQMLNVNASAFIRVPFNVANPTDFASVRLGQRWNDGFTAWLNGTQIATHNAPGALAYNSAATGTHSGSVQQDFDFALPANLLRAGSNVLAIHGLNTTANDGTFLILPQLTGLGAPSVNSGYISTPTPGAANAPLKTNVGPFVSDVTRNPIRPTGTAASPPLTITAKVVPSLRPLAASNPVQLKYLVMYNAEQTVNMADNGVAPDATPNDGIYTVQIPTNTLGAGQMLRWRVVATDNTAITGTGPEYADPLDNEQYYGTVALDSSIESNLPILYSFTPNSTAGDNATGTRNSFFFKALGDPGVGRFYDNVEINLHGQSSSGFAKKSYDLDFNEDNRFEWSAIGDRVKDINLMTNWGDKAKLHNTLTHEAAAAIGAPSHWCFQVRVQQVTPTNAATPANHFFSIADMMEDGDDLWIERLGLGEGALYKTYDNLSSSNNSEKKSRLNESKADLDALIAGLNPGLALATRRQYAYDNLDLAQCASYFVACAIASHQDHGHKNFYVYRDSTGTREWSIIIWDVDLSWGRNWTDAQGYFTDTIYTDNVLNQYNNAQQPSKGTMNRLYTIMFDSPEFRKMYLRRLRTVMDTYFNVPGLLEARVNAMTDAMDPPAIGNSDADRDRARWGTWGNDGGFTVGGQVLRYHTGIVNNSYIAGRRTWLNSASALLAYTGGTEPIPAAQPANAADLITLETVDFKPATNTQEHEFFVVRNANSYAVDISGWQITGAVNWTFKPGTVLPAGGGATEHIGDLYVAKNPFLFRQRISVPDDNQPAANRYRFVQGPYSGQLSARGETIELRDAAGTLLKTKTWTPAPTATQNQLRITELNYAPVLPTPAETAALPGVVESDFEFVELLNTGATPLTLTGAYFEEGVTFTFPAFTLNAGARCLIVGNLAAFQLRYGHAFDSQIAGAYAGNLDNNGETIQLMDVSGENILDFSYNNSWFPPSDEGGRSLVIRNANPDWSTYDLPQSWALSGNPGGSPGAADTDFANVYEGWRWDYFTAAEMPTPLQPTLPAAVNQDPDGDGLINLAEYAYGRAPRTHDNGAPLAVPGIVNVGGTNYLAITFNRRHKALDLTYLVEASGDLSNWTAVDLPVGGVTDLGNGVERVTYRDNTAYISQAKRFLRVRAIKP